MTSSRVGMDSTPSCSTLVFSDEIVRLHAGEDLLLRQRRLLQLFREGEIGLVEGRRAEAAHVLVHGLLQRLVRQHVRGGIGDLHRDRGLRHQRGALGDLLHALEQALRIGQMRRAHEIERFRKGLHHVRRAAAGIGGGVMHARIGGHVLAHVVHAHIHQLHRIERGAAHMGCRRRMRRAALEAEIGLDAGERRAGLHLVDDARMPAEGGVEIVNRPARAMKVLPEPLSSAGQP